MTRLDPSSYDALVFDLGGVILDLDFGATISAFSRLSGADASHLYTQTRQVDLFDEFERGEIAPEAFRARLRERLQLGDGTSDVELDAAWNALLGSIPEDRLQLLRRLKQETRTFLLSNTNAIHIGQFLLDYGARHETAHGAWSDLFEKPLYSHELGARKPERRIFDRVAEQFGLEPSRIVFIDDNADNVAAARDAGWRAEHHTPDRTLAGYF